MSLVDDRLSAVVALLGRLEDDPDFPAEPILLIQQRPGKTQSDGRVSVMAAGMDPIPVAGNISFIVRAKTVFFRLLIRETIDIESKSGDRTFSSRVQFCDYTGIAAGSFCIFRLRP